MDSIQTKTGYIYAIENNFDTSVYVGLTIKTIKERFAQHLQAARSNRASCILHLFMAKHGPDNFFIRELRKVEYHSIIELQLVEQECIRDFGNLNTVYNSRSYEMGGLTLERIIQERKPKEKPVCVSKVPPKEDVMEIACEAEEVPNKKISLDKFIGLFIPEEENFGHILNDLTVKGNIHVSSRVLEWFGYEGEYRLQKRNFIKMLKNNEIPYQELTQKDDEIKRYPTIKEEISLLPSNVTNSKFLIMEPKDIKMAIMQLKTKNGHIIRQYYIDLEDLMKLYVEYTLAFNERRALYKIESLEKMMEDMRLCNERQEKILAEVRDQNENLKESLFEVRDQNEISMTS
jgi:MSV199 domain/GIY-YIG catalytic domain